MPIWRNNKLPFLDEVLELPYICQSVIDKESKKNMANIENDAQTTLVECFT